MAVTVVDYYYCYTLEEQQEEVKDVDLVGLVAVVGIEDDTLHQIEVVVVVVVEEASFVAYYYSTSRCFVD